MKIFHAFKYLAVDPVNFSLKTKLRSLLACFYSIFFVALITKMVLPWRDYPMIVASMGGAAIILFIISGSPLTQPGSFVGGQRLSVVVGEYYASNIVKTFTAAASAVGDSVMMMLVLRCLCPPAHPQQRRV